MMNATHAKNATNTKNAQFVDFALLHCVVTAAHKCWYLRIRPSLKQWRERQLKAKYVSPGNGECLACGWSPGLPDSPLLYHFQWDGGCNYLRERYAYNISIYNLCENDGHVEYKTRHFGDGEMMFCCPYPQ